MALDLSQFHLVCSDQLHIDQAVEKEIANVDNFLAGRISTTSWQELAKRPTKFITYAYSSWLPYLLYKLYKSNRYYVELQKILLSEENNVILAYSCFLSAPWAALALAAMRSS